MNEPKTQRTVEVRVQPLPRWLDSERLLGPGFSLSACADGEDTLCATGRPTVEAAASLAARLRGLGIDGRPLQVHIRPELSRNAVRAGRLEEARARRDTTPGFTSSSAQASGEGRFSLTPESLALAMGKLAQGRSIVDASCGSGGNTLGFARAGCKVTAIELDAQRLAEARHNAAVYGQTANIRFVHGDARSEISKHSAEILFLDPPWGEQYDKRSTTRADFPLLDALLDLPLRGYRELWLKLPASFATSSVKSGMARAWFGEAAGDRQRIKFIQLCIPLDRDPP